MRARRRFRPLVWLGSVLFSLPLLAAVALALVALSREVSVPPWAHERIDRFLTDRAPGLQIETGDIRLRLTLDFALQVTVDRATVETDQGVRVIDLTQAVADWPLTAPLHGHVAPRTVSVRGGILRLKRARGPSGDWVVMLEDGDGQTPLDLPDLPTAVTAMDAVLSRNAAAGFSSLSIEGMRVAYADGRVGRTWSLDAAQFRATRLADTVDFFADADLTGLGDTPARITLTAESEIGFPSLDFSIGIDDVRAGDLATQVEALAWLSPFDAPISGNITSYFDEAGGLGEVHGRLALGPGNTSDALDGTDLPFRAARAYFSYDPLTQDLLLNEISVRSPIGVLNAAGQFTLFPGPDGWPAEMVGQVRATDLALREDIDGIRAIDMAGAHATFRMRFDPLKLQLGDLDFGDDLPIVAKGVIEERGGGLHASFDASAAVLAREDLLRYWPGGLAEPTRRWLERNLPQGRVENARLAIRHGPDRARPLVHADLRLADAIIRYNPALPPITGAAGRVTVSNGRLGARLDAGTIAGPGGGPVSVGGSAFTIADLGATPMQGTLHLNATGAVPAVLSYLDNDRWQLLRRAGRTPDVATGFADIGGTIAFPMQRGVPTPLEQVAFDLSGTLRDVASDTLVPGRPVRAARLALRVSDAMLSVSGAASVDTVPARVDWRQPVGGGTAALRVDFDLSRDVLARFAPAVPRDRLSGQGPAQLTLAFTPGQQPQMRLQSDLAGIGFAIPGLDWRMTRAQTGTLEIAGPLPQPGSQAVLDTLRFEAPGFLAEGRLDGPLLTLDRVRVGDWLDVAATIGPAGIDVVSGRADIRGGLPGARGGRSGDGDGNRPAPRPVTLALDSLRISDKILLSAVRGSFNQSRARSGNFTARIGGAPISGRLRPDGDAWRLRVESDEAGAVLESAGLSDAVAGGRMRVDLVPIAGGGGLDGVIDIDRARVTKAPLTATLLDQMSVVGIIDRVEGPGIFFPFIDARFRIADGLVTITEGRAVGPSLAVTVDGYIDQATNTLDLQGVVSPFYIVNGVGQIISSRLGEGLFGITFTMRGDPDAPEVGFNPLSILTPGALREIWRRQAPDLP